MAGVEDLNDDYLLQPFSEPKRKAKRSRDEDTAEAPEEEREPIEASLIEEEVMGEDAVASKKSSKKQKKNKTPQPPKEKQPKKEKDLSAKTRELRKEIFELANATESEVDIPEERSLENLLKFVTGMREVDDEKIVLIVTPSAERAIAIIPVLKPIGKIGKVFARHMKLEEQIKAQETHKYTVSVGAASRIVKLVNAGAIAADKVGFVIMDATYADKKKRTLFDIPELKTDLVELLKIVKTANVIVF
ncbi:cms1 ribosomal small subunit [Podochytrium sp. JEL0797]|nr:cms1 ribosomal small subunit [Podochytrium sp. JEL0797]